MPPPRTRGLLELPVPGADPVDAGPRMEPGERIRVDAVRLRRQMRDRHRIGMKTEIAVAVRQVGPGRHIATGDIPAGRPQGVGRVLGGDLDAGGIAKVAEDVDAPTSGGACPRRGCASVVSRMGHKPPLRTPANAPATSRSRVAPVRPGPPSAIQDDAGREPRRPAPDRRRTRADWRRYRPPSVRVARDAEAATPGTGVRMARQQREREPAASQRVVIVPVHHGVRGTDMSGADRRVRQDSAGRLQRSMPCRRSWATRRTNRCRSVPAGASRRASARSRASRKAGTVGIPAQDRRAADESQDSNRDVATRQERWGPSWPRQALPACVRPVTGRDAGRSSHVGSLRLRSGSDFRTGAANSPVLPRARPPS